MLVDFDFENVSIDRTIGDGLRFRRGGRGGSAESQLLHHVKMVLRGRGIDVLKKRMYQDGHLVDDTVQCVRDRKGTFVIFNPSYNEMDAGRSFNANGHVTLRMVRRPTNMPKGSRLRITAPGDGSVTVSVVQSNGETILPSVGEVSSAAHA